jgi:hypothetical protein
MQSEAASLPAGELELAVHAAHVLAPMDWSSTLEFDQDPLQNSNHSVFRPV